MVSYRFIIIIISGLLAHLHVKFYRYKTKIWFVCCPLEWFIGRFFLFGKCKEEISRRNFKKPCIQTLT